MHLVSVHECELRELHLLINAVSPVQPTAFLPCAMIKFRFIQSHFLFP